MKLNDFRFYEQVPTDQLIAYVRKYLPIQALMARWWIIIFSNGQHIKLSLETVSLFYYIY